MDGQVSFVRNLKRLQSTGLMKFVCASHVLTKLIFFRNLFLVNIRNLCPLKTPENLQEPRNVFQSKMMLL